jgi:hypothetical protein
MLPTKNDHSILLTLMQVIGEKATAQLMQPGAFGGRSIVIPKSGDGRSKRGFVALSEVIGKDAALRLCKHFGGDQIYVPKDSKRKMYDRNRRIVTAYNNGAGINALVSEFGLSDRHIRSILKETDMTTPLPSADERH